MKMYGLKMKKIALQLCSPGHSRIQRNKVRLASINWERKALSFVLYIVLVCLNKFRDDIWIPDPDIERLDSLNGFSTGGMGNMASLKVC